MLTNFQPTCLQVANCEGIVSTTEDEKMMMMMSD